MPNLAASITPLSGKVRYFVVFHYFRSNAFQLFLKNLNFHPLFIFPRSFRKFSTPLYSSLGSSVSGFSFIITFPTPESVFSFSKTLKSYPRAGFILFYYFDNGFFLPQDLPRIRELYESNPPGSLVVKPFFSLILGHHSRLQNFFLRPFFNFFFFFINSRGNSKHANI